MLWKSVLLNALTIGIIRHTVNKNALRPLLCPFPPFRNSNLTITCPWKCSRNFPTPCNPTSYFWEYVRRDTAADMSSTLDSRTTLLWFSSLITKSSQEPFGISHVKHRTVLFQICSVLTTWLFQPWSYSSDRWAKWGVKLPTTQKWRGFNFSTRLELINSGEKYTSTWCQLTSQWVFTFKKKRLFAVLFDVWGQFISLLQCSYF